MPKNLSPNVVSHIDYFANESMRNFHTFFRVTFEIIFCEQIEAYHQILLLRYTLTLEKHLKTQTLLVLVYFFFNLKHINIICKLNLN